IASYGLNGTDTNIANLKKPVTALRLPPSHRRLRFEFAALSFSAPENVRFQYRLEGFDTGWVDAGTQSSVDYSRLESGNYYFRIQARNGGGSWNPEPASLGIIIAPFFWQTWWCRLGLATLLSVAIGGTVRYASFRRLRLKLRTLEQRAA